MQTEFHRVTGMGHESAATPCVIIANSPRAPSAVPRYALAVNAIVAASTGGSIAAQPRSSDLAARMGAVLRVIRVLLSRNDGDLPASAGYRPCAICMPEAYLRVEEPRSAGLKLTSYVSALDRRSFDQAGEHLGDIDALLFVFALARQFPCHVHFRQLRFASRVEPVRRTP